MRGDGKLRKFYSELDEGILLGYYCNSKAYKCYNLILNKLVESINARVGEGISCKEEEEENENKTQQEKGKQE